MSEWSELLEAVQVHTALFIADASNLDLDAPSALPGWNRKHVLAHVLGNARGFGRLARWACDGVERPVYVSVEARDADIVQRATWSSDELLDAVAHSAAELDREFAALDATARDRIVRRYNVSEFPGGWIPVLRLQEIVIHHTDLGGTDFTHLQWPDELVERLWPDIAKEYAQRADAPVGFVNDDRFNDSDAGVRGSHAAALAWLLGRSAGADLELVGMDALPTPPNWR